MRRGGSSPPPRRGAGGARVYSLAQWWATTRQYTGAGAPPAQSFALRREHTFRALPFGSRLSENSTQYVVRASLSQFGGTLPLDREGLYMVFSSAEIKQSGFCSQRCGFHSYTLPGLLRSPARPSSTQQFDASRGPQVPFLWVGNAAQQCPGFCGFPFKAPPYIPPQFAKTVKPPSGNLAMDSFILILAHEIAESATDPFFSGWFLGDKTMPTEIADLCLGTFGPGAFPGDPGAVTRAWDGSGYNVLGPAGERFLLQNLWSSKQGGCSGGS